MKRYFTLVLVLISSLLSSNELSLNHAISYQGGDRFGDRMLVYAQARYLSYITSVPFLYRPFIYSHLITADYDALAFDEHKDNYREVRLIDSFASLNDMFQRIKNPETPPTLFILDYFPSDITEWERNSSNCLLLNINWNHEGFHDYLNLCASPLISIPDLTREGVLNVADHVRTLSGQDTPETSQQFLPLKCPKLDYHKKQIRRVYELNGLKPMHVFIFSDTKDPESLLNSFKESFIGYNIEFGIQFLENPDTNYAVQDFFAMQKFDVLIATQSNFSMMSWRIGSPEMVIFPIRVQGSYPNTWVDRIQLISKKSSWFPYEMNITAKDY